MSKDRSNITKPLNPTKLRKRKLKIKKRKLKIKLNAKKPKKKLKIKLPTRNSIKGRIRKNIA